MTNSRHIEESTSVNTNINTIGWQILAQSLIRYGTIFAIVWLTLTFANEWVMVAIAR